MVESIGWFAGILFAFCGFPQAVLSIKQGHSDGVSKWLLLMWGLGEILSIFYVFLKHGLDLPLLFNYTVNIVFILVISKYKILPRRRDGSN